MNQGHFVGFFFINLSLSGTLLIKRFLSSSSSHAFFKRRVCLGYHQGVKILVLTLWDYSNNLFCMQVLGQGNSKLPCFNKGLHPRQEANGVVYESWNKVCHYWQWQLLVWSSRSYASSLEFSAWCYVRSSSQSYQMLVEVAYENFKVAQSSFKLMDSNLDYICVNKRSASPML